MPRVASGPLGALAGRRRPRPPSRSTVLDLAGQRLEVVGEPGQSRGAGSDRRVVAAGGVERRRAGRRRRLAVVGRLLAQVLGAPRSRATRSTEPGLVLLGERLQGVLVAGRAGGQRGQPQRPRSPRLVVGGAEVGRAARRRRPRTGAAASVGVQLGERRWPPQRAPPRPRPPRRQPRPRASLAHGVRLRLRPVGGARCCRTPGSRRRRCSPAASSAAMPSSRAWRSRSQRLAGQLRRCRCGPAAGRRPRAGGPAARRARSAACSSCLGRRRRRRGRRAARRSRPGCASRAPSSAALRRAGARLEQGGESLCLAVELDDPSLERVGGGCQPVGLGLVAGQGRQPADLVAVVACGAPAGRRARATGRPRPATESVPVAGSASASRTTGRPRRPPGPARARPGAGPPRSTSGINGRPLRAAASCGRDRRSASSRRRPARSAARVGLQAGPPGACLGDQRGGLQRGGRGLVLLRWRAPRHLLGGRASCCRAWSSQCGDPAVEPGERRGSSGRSSPAASRDPGQHPAQPLVDLVEARGRSPCGGATSQRSTSANRPVSKRLSSRSRRFSASARRNSANWPWGSSTTWQNCASVSPSRPPTWWPVSSSRVDSVVQPAVAVLLEVDPGLLGDRAGAAPLRPLPLRRPGEPQPAAAQASPRGRPRGADPLGGVVAAQRPRCRPRAPGTWP